MGNSNFLMEENLVTDNVNKGFNFRGCAGIVRHNRITGNGNGIFIFEKDSGLVISENNIYDNQRFNLRLGDFFRGHLSVENNWWGSEEERLIRKTIYDSRFDEEIGSVSIRPSPRPHDILSTVLFPREGYTTSLP